MCPVKIEITYSNGSADLITMQRYHEAITHCRENVSYSGGKVKRVEIHHHETGGGAQAIWDSSWDFQSQIAGLFN